MHLFFCISKMGIFASPTFFWKLYGRKIFKVPITSELVEFIGNFERYDLIVLMCENHKNQWTINARYAFT